MKKQDRLTEKEKRFLKTTGITFAILGIFSFYYNLWKDGNTWQRIRMALSWVLFCLIILLLPENRELERIQTGHYNDTGAAITFFVWISFVFWSWGQRRKENESKDKEDKKH